MNTLISKTKLLVSCFYKDQDGVTAIEYALIAALVAVVIIGGATLLGTNLNTLFTNIAGKI